MLCFFGFLAANDGTLLLFSQVLSAFYSRLVLLFCPIINGPVCQGDVFVMQL